MCARGTIQCGYCGCKVHYEGQRPFLCIDCAAAMRGEYRHRGAPHAPACGCTRCRQSGPLLAEGEAELWDLLDGIDGGAGIDLAALARGEGHSNG